MLFDGLDLYLWHTLNSEPWHINWLKLKKYHFSSLQTILICQVENPFKTDVNVKNSMSVSSNSIARFLNFAVKILKQKV